MEAVSAVASSSGLRWLDPGEVRVGLGCMRLSTGDTRDSSLALATITAAVAAGITVFDTAHAYGRDATEAGHNERLLAQALRASGAERPARIVTKCGMTRAGGGWMPDGRAGALLSDCEASLAALGGLPIDLMLIHAPDQRTPWRTSVRALARMLDEGMVRHVGVSNVNRQQLDDARDIVDVTAIEIALSVLDEAAVRSGLVEHCEKAGIAVIAHSPLGGPRRARTLARHPALRDVALRHDSTTAEIALAWLLDLSPTVIPIPGARRPATAQSAERAAHLQLDADDRAILDRGFPRHAPASVRRSTATRDGEVVMVMGIPGSGKSRRAAEYVARGYRRLNRDERGGSLRDLAAVLHHEMTAGAREFVLDNTYLTRASRSYVVDTAGVHGLAVRCVWMDTPLAQAQVNIVERLLDRFGALPSPEDLRLLSRREPGILTPTSQMRALREVEPPSPDEGFAAVECVRFERTPATDAGRPGVFVAAGARARPDWDGAFGACDHRVPHLVFEWNGDGDRASLDATIAVLAAQVSGPVDGGLCPHGGGPPRCWCRPPLPGLLLALSRGLGVDPAQSTLIGTGPAHRTLATTLGARYIEA
ncbi:MAG: aldo/keto reductase [Candidatus Dormiibacterota bacterium]